MKLKNGTCFEVTVKVIFTVTDEDKSKGLKFLKNIEGVAYGFETRNNEYIPIVGFIRGDNDESITSDKELEKEIGLRCDTYLETNIVNLGVLD